MARLNKLDFAEKVNLSVTISLIITIIAAIIVSSIDKNWFLVFISSCALILMFAPTIFERTTKIDLPVEFEILIVLFIYSSIILGEVFDFYNLFWGWDVFLHAISAIGLGFIGFMMLFALYKTEKIKARPLTIAVFTFTFALSVGALWEIFEFFMDSNFGFNMQKSGLVDTMWDLITDAIGALFTSIIGFIYLRKKGRLGLLELVVHNFEKNNPQVFRN